MQGTHSSEQKEAIPHFSLIFTIFLGWRSELQGQFSYIDIFSTMAREIGTKTGHELASTYPRVF